MGGELPLLPFGYPIGPSTLLRMVSLPFEGLRVRQAHPTPKYPEEDRGAVSLPNRSNHFVPASRGGVYIKLTLADLDSKWPYGLIG